MAPNSHFDCFRIKTKKNRRLKRRAQQNAAESSTNRLRRYLIRPNYIKVKEAKSRGRVNGAAIKRAP